MWDRVQRLKSGLHDLDHARPVVNLCDQSVVHLKDRTGALKCRNFARSS